MRITSSWLRTGLLAGCAALWLAGAAEASLLAVGLLGVPMLRRRRKS